MALRLIPTYYSAPNFSIPPPDVNGPLHLGTVIADLKDPVPLNPGIHLPISEDEIKRTSLTGFSTTISRSRNVQLGIFAQLLNLQSVGGQLGTNRCRSGDETLSVDRLETQWFNPSLEYMNGSMNLQPVKAFRQACRDRLPVFLVTGIKVARGASASVVKAKSAGRSAQLGMTQQPLTNFAEVGSRATYEQTVEQQMTFEGSSDFVLAYRVTRMVWKKVATAGRAYTSGATLVGDDYSLTRDDQGGRVEFTHDFFDESVDGQLFDEPGFVATEATRWVILDAA